MKPLPWTSGNFLLIAYHVTEDSDDGAGSLRRAIETANREGRGGRIIFAIGSGHQTIRLATPLPPITVCLAVDGASQPGFSGKPLIEIDGTAAGSSTRGLHILANGCSVNGLVVGGFQGDGIFLESVSRCRITGNYIGTDSGGTTARPNAANGITLKNASGNEIGGKGPGEGNLASGNAYSGIFVENSKGNYITRNLVGTDASGLNALSNRSSGIIVQGKAMTGAPNVISGNVVSGNVFSGVSLSESTGDIVAGNLLGTDINGAAALKNGINGLTLINSAFNRIGGSSVSERNIVSGNGLYGINIFGPRSVGNSILGNFVGTDVAGKKAVANLRTGILIFNSPLTVIGGSGEGQGNLVSGNGRGGINIDGSAVHDHIQGEFSLALPEVDRNVGGLGHSRDTVIEGNLIGTDLTGQLAVPNALHGILLYESQKTRIGGEGPGQGNTISGNGRDGILLIGNETAGDLDCTGNVIAGNRIGTDPSGSRAIPNRRAGIFICKAVGNCVGGTASGAGNVISANGVQGVRISGATASGNLVLGNTIGTDASGAVALGNAGDGVMINDAPGNHVGYQGVGNLICGNGRHGVMITGPMSQGNQVNGNRIGTAHGNVGHGILISGPAAQKIDPAHLAAANIATSNGRRDIHAARPAAVAEPA